MTIVSRGSRACAVLRALTSHQCVPGSIPRPGVICGLSLLLVLYSASRGFSPGTPVFPSPQIPTFPNSNLIWNCLALYHEPLARVIVQALPVFDIKLAFTFFLHSYMTKCFFIRLNKTVGKYLSVLQEAGDEQGVRHFVTALANSLNR